MTWTRFFQLVLAGMVGMLVVVSSFLFSFYSAIIALAGGSFDRFPWLTALFVLVNIIICALTWRRLDRPLLTISLWSLFWAMLVACFFGVFPFGETDSRRMGYWLLFSSMGLFAGGLGGLSYIAMSKGRSMRQLPSVAGGDVLSDPAKYQAYRQALRNEGDHQKRGPWG